jgi:putative transcriptional regulator
MNSKMLHYTDGGLKNVWLLNGFEIRKTPYGKGVAIHDIDGLTNTICLALTNKSSPLTGVEFRYVRSAAMLLSHH